MHLVRYQLPGQRPQVGVLTGDTVAPVRGVAGMAELLRLPLDELRSAVAQVGEVAGISRSPTCGCCRRWTAGARCGVPG